MENSTKTRTIFDTYVTFDNAEYECSKLDCGAVRLTDVYEIVEDKKVPYIFDEIDTK